MIQAAKVEWNSMPKNMKVIYQNLAEDEKRKNKVQKTKKTNLGKNK